eukprot:CAMPEP_0113676838 /NCGR_PEP_ID=MMETSP0038_2-20120614/8891_1 /TAXON_ID=2898 /ORGANISM="Cryptomonas paramecium" /LENGTH=318 /DNA_ID=CAMNT_0000593963 /DNA_START=452 /DNA_END=1408 /DNA_ORIENTATION=- /assembly_acc=CAM_ASM_000170
MSFERKFQIRSRSTTAPNGLGLLRNIVGFTSLAASMHPCEAAAMLYRLFARFDTLAKQHGVQPIDIIGDSYFAATNLNGDQSSDHAARIARFALDAVRAASETAVECGREDGGRVQVASGVGVAGEADAHRGHGEHGEPDGEHGAGGVRAVHAGHGGAHRAAGPEPEPVSARGACGAEGDGDDGDVLGDARARACLPVDGAASCGEACDAHDRPIAAEKTDKAEPSNSCPPSHLDAFSNGAPAAATSETNRRRENRQSRAVEFVPTEPSDAFSNGAPAAATSESTRLPGHAEAPPADQPSVPAVPNPEAAAGGGGVAA